MWVLLRGVQVLLFAAALAVAFAVIPHSWGRSASRAALLGIFIPFGLGMLALEPLVKRARRSSLDHGLEADGFKVFSNASDANVYALLMKLRKEGFHGFCDVVGFRGNGRDAQIVAEYDREEGRGRNRATIYYSIVAVPCDPRWQSIVVYRWSVMNWLWGTRFFRKRPDWAKGRFRWRMVVEPREAPCPSFLSRRLQRWLARSPWWCREHWSVDDGWLLVSRRGRLTRGHVRKLLERCERFKRIGDGFEL